MPLFFYFIHGYLKKIDNAKLLENNKIMYTTHISREYETYTIY